MITKPMPILYFLALVGALCFLYSYFIEPYWIEVKTLDIYTDKLKGANVKIVQISDLHCDKKVRNEYKLADIINPLKPDIIVFTGDTLNTPAALPVFKDAMKKLNASIGKYAVRGNFDVWFWSDLDLFDDTGFEILDKGTVKLTKDHEVFFISGLSYEHQDEYYDVLKNIPSEHYSILLYHTPDLIEDLKGLSADLYLAGHTHGGQIAIPFYGAVITFSRYGKRYEAGKYIVDNTLLYVNRGIGMEGGVIPRVRFCSRPEITVFDLKPKSPKNLKALDKFFWRWYYFIL